MHGAREEPGQPPYELGTMLFCLTCVAWRAYVRGGGCRVALGGSPGRVSSASRCAAPWRSVVSASRRSVAPKHEERQHADDDEGADADRTGQRRDKGREPAADHGLVDRSAEGG